MKLFPFFLYFLTDVGEIQHGYLYFRNVNFMTIGAMKTLIYLWMQMKFSYIFCIFLSVWTIFGIDVKKFIE